MINPSSHWMKYSGVGIQLVAIMMICWWVGMKSEELVKFIYYPWGQVSGIFFGIFAGMYNLIKSVQN